MTNNSWHFKPIDEPDFCIGHFQSIHNVINVVLQKCLYRKVLLFPFHYSLRLWNVKTGRFVFAVLRTAVLYIGILRIKLHVYYNNIMFYFSSLSLISSFILLIIRIYILVSHSNKFPTVSLIRHDHRSTWV